MRTAIVVGATSMLGREIVRQLSADGIQVIRAGRDPDSDIVIDLGSGKKPRCRIECRADVILHCASAFGPDSVDGVRENLRVNVAGCADVLEIAQLSGARKTVYAGSLWSDPSVDSGLGLTSYGLTKAEAECVLDWGMTRSGGEFCSLRLTQLWDTEGMCCAHQPWFGRIVAYANRGLVLRMPAAQGPRNFMHVSDAARLMILAARGALRGVHVASHPESVDLRWLADEAYRLFDKGGSIEIDRTKTPFRKICYPDAADLFSTLDFSPRITLAHGLRLIREAGTANRFGPVDVQ